MTVTSAEALRGPEVSQHPAARNWLPAVAIVVGLACAIGLQVVRERRYPQIASPVDELYFTSGEAVGRLALSYKSLLADVYWIRAIQYFAATRLQDRPIVGQDLLYPLLDVTTALDPAFNIAYRFGAIFLSEDQGSGLGRPDLAIELLDKGFRLNPHKWEYLYDKGFVYYWSYRDYKAAAHWFTEASKVPDSAEWLPGLAGYMLTAGGDRRTSRFLFQQIYQTAEQEYMRKLAELRLAQLDILDRIDRLNAALDRYAAETGARARSWEELAARRILPGIPVDPDGKPFVIDPETGRATLDPSSQYYPLPAEFVQTPPPSGAQPPSAPRPGPRS